MFQGTLDGEFTFCKTLKTHNLIFDESVDERQWEAGHVECGINLSLVLVLIVPAQGAELLIVEHEVGLDGMGVILLHQIYQLGADIADGGSLIGHVLYGHIRDHREFLVLVLQDMVIAVELAGDLRQIGYHGGDFTQIDTIAR